MKTVLGDKKIHSVLRRLDRLTQQVSQMTVAQMTLAQTETLDVVCGLVVNMRVVMEGVHLPVWFYAQYKL